MDPAQVTQFVASLAGAAQMKAVYEEVENSKRAAYDRLFEELTPTLKDEIREGMRFHVVDKKGRKKGSSVAKGGQEASVDTEGAVKQGYGISKEDQPKVQRAMDAIVQLTRKAIDRIKDLKRPEDKDKPVDQQRPVYDLSKKEDREKFTALIEVEVFTPLVREGILLETFVLDDFSEVQKLLNATFAQYRNTLQESAEEEERKKTEKIAKLHAESGRLHGIKKLQFKAEEYKEYLSDRYAPSEDAQRRIKIGKEGAKAAWKMIQAGKSISRLLPTEDGSMPKGVLKQDRFLNPEKYKDTLSEERLGRLGGSTDPDALRMQLEQQRQETKMVERFAKIGAVLKLSPEQSEGMAHRIVGIMELKDDDRAFYTKSSAELLKGLASGGKDIGESGAKIYSLSEEQEKRLKELVGEMAIEEEVEKAVEDLIETIDGALVAGVTKGISAEAADAFSGAYLAEIDSDAVTKAAVAGDAGKLVSLLGDAIEETFRTAAYEPLDPVFSWFSTAGQGVATAFRKQANGTLRGSDIQQKPAETLDPLGDVAFECTTKNIPVELKNLLTDPQALRKLASKAAVPNEEEALEELERSDQELKEYERQLTLIDETGISLAEQRSIENLIAQLKQDREILEMVSFLGETLTGAAGGAVNIAAWASEALTDVVSGQVGSALKAAKLIMQLAINTKKAADRWALWYKFKTNLQRSKKAVSSLSTTIQGFFDNKKEQIAFHTIEDALIAVQIAAAILGAVPNEYAMAVGKTMSVVASAAQQTLKVSQMIYNEAKLSEAWAITKAAMDSPRDRALGLKAIAWAALEKMPADPIARMVLNSLGIDEQSLAAGATEKKVREYLTTLLDEDRQLTDSSKIVTDWAPETFTLSVKDWFTVTSRGQRLAVPKLRAGDEKSVLAALQKTDTHNLKALEADARLGLLDDPRAQQLESEAKALCEVLNNYRPVATDGSVHTEMSSLGDEFLRYATTHKEKVLAILDINRGVRDPDRAHNLLDEQIETFEDLIGKEGQEHDPPPSVTPDAAEKACNDAKQVLDELKSIPAFHEIPEVQTKITRLQALVNMTRFWILSTQSTRRGS